MIRLGLRLALASGREAAVRLTVIAAAVALGVGMLLTTVAGVNAVDTQNNRYVWLNSAIDADPDPASGDTDPLWWQLREDYYHGRSIGRLDVAATGARSPVPPGIPRLPGPGEYYASPALDELLRTTPAPELGDRFPGHRIGTIDRAALAGPDALLVVVGHTPDEMTALPGAQKITRILGSDRARCSGCYVGIDNAGMKLVLAVVGAGLLFPLLILVGTATRLSAARREQRFAAMRLVGATPRQISVLSAVESTVATAIGTAAGYVLFYAFRSAVATIPFTDIRFYPYDLDPKLTGAAGVAVGIPLAAAMAARLALRRVRISPLGVTRRVTPRPPRAWRLIPLLLGTGELVYFVGRRPATTDGQIQAYLSGIFLIMIGLVVAGPWLTMTGSRLLARNASRPATLIAARRLSDDPRAGFRAVSGLMLALFVTSVATGVITTMVTNRGGPRSDSVTSTTMAKTVWPEEQAQGQTALTPESVPPQLATMTGVRRVTLVRLNPVPSRSVPYEQWWPGVISCAELAQIPAYGRCAPGVEVVAVTNDLVVPSFERVAPRDKVWPAAAVPAASLAQLPVLSVVVDTDGSAVALERVRTVLETTYPAGRFPFTEHEWQANMARDLVKYQRLADVIILASLPVAGCSLAVSVIGGLNDRRRPFSMLRLTGAPLGVLRRVVALETAVPLLVVTAVALGMGLLAAHLFLRSQLDYSLVALPVSYYLLVAAGIAASLGIVATTLPLLRRVTGPEIARNE